MSGGVSFGGSNINHGAQALGDGDAMTGNVQKGDGNTMNVAGSDLWQEAIDAAQEIDSEQVAADVVEIKELSQGDDDAQAETVSERLRAAAPGVLKLVAAAVLKGPQGLAAEAILQVAKKLE